MYQLFVQGLSYLKCKDGKSQIWGKTQIVRLKVIFILYSRLDFTDYSYVKVKNNNIKDKCQGTKVPELLKSTVKLTFCILWHIGAQWLRQDSPPQHNAIIWMCLIRQQQQRLKPRALWINTLWCLSITLKGEGYPAWAHSSQWWIL